MNFYSLYNSFESFFDSFFRGNEIEFLYDNEHFFILPMYDNNHNVVGVEFGKANCKHSQKIFSKDDLFNAKMGDTSLGLIIDYLEIIWYNF